MSIRDMRSDVCSSDLPQVPPQSTPERYLAAPAGDHEIGDGGAARGRGSRQGRSPLGHGGPSFGGARRTFCLALSLPRGVRRRNADLICSTLLKYIGAGLPPPDEPPDCRADDDYRGDGGEGRRTRRGEEHTCEARAAG